MPKKQTQKRVRKVLDAWLEAQKPMFEDLREIEALCHIFEIKWGIKIQVSIAKQSEEKGGRMLAIGEVEELFSQEFTNKIAKRHGK